MVLQFFPDGEDLVLAAANDAGATNPGWYHNLKAHPEARVEVEGRTLRVNAVELPAEEARAWWRRIVELSPSYGIYERATTRAFPIIRLQVIGPSS